MPIVLSCGSVAFDMTDWDLSDIGSGAAISASFNTVQIAGAGGAYVYTLQGAQFGSFDAEGIPHSGTITSISIALAGAAPGTTPLTLSGSSLDVASFMTFVANNDAAGLEHAILGGDTNYINGSAGNDVLFDLGPSGIIDLSQGGDDTFRGSSGRDTISMRQALTAADNIDGGGGNDSLDINGLNLAPLVLSPTTLTNIASLTIEAGPNFSLTLNAATVPMGHQMSIGLSGTGDTLDGSQVAGNLYIGASGSRMVIGGSGNDTISVQSGIIDLSHGGNDTASNSNGVGAGFGAVTFDVGGALTAADTISGKADTLELDGDYSHGIAIDPAHVTGIATFLFGAGHSYNVTLPNEPGYPNLTVNGFQLLASDSLIFNAASETLASLVFFDGNGNDSFTGGSRADTFAMESGNDTVQGGAGDDIISFVIEPGTFTAADRIDGGAGNDTVRLSGNTAVAFRNTTMVNVETLVLTLSLTSPLTYRLTTADATVAAGQTLTVQVVNGGGSSNIGVGILDFNGSKETDGHFDIVAASTNDAVAGGAQSDTFDLSLGGNDFVNGEAGDDSFLLGAALTAADRIDGGAGNDTLTLNGDYSAGVAFNARTVVNVETLLLTAGHSYALTLAAATVAAGQSMTVDGFALASTNTLTLDGRKIAAGHLTLDGGGGADMLLGGGGGNTLYGGLGADKLYAGAGADVFAYHLVSESAGLGFDAIAGFDATADSFALPFAVSAVDPTIASGALRKATFDSDLAAAADAAHLGAGHAVLFTPGAGGYAGRSFLIIDGNGMAGYQAGQDIVIQLLGAAHLDQLGAGNFTTS